MPAPVHGRVRIGGALFSDARWSIGINFGSGQGTDPFANFTSDVPAALATWRDNIKAMNGGQVIPGPFKNMIGGDGTVDEIRVARIGLDGKESDVALVDIAPAISGSGNGAHPAQTALAISLQTGRPGASYRGRFYMPFIGINIDGGRLTATQTASFASTAAQFIGDLQSAADGLQGVGGIHAVVVSTTRNALTRVTSVRVGNRLDSQRRRAEGQEELYSVAGVAQ